MTDQWRWDDLAIPPSEHIYRHVEVVPTPRGPKKRQDPTTGRWSLTKAAFTSDEMKEDGWSIYRRELLTRNNLSVDDIERSGSVPREAWEVTVGDVRQTKGSGVVDDEDFSDPVLGKAHGLIRCSNENLTREKINELRSALIETARPFRSAER